MIKTSAATKKLDEDKRAKTNRLGLRIASFAIFAVVAYLLRRAGASWGTSISVACIAATVVWLILLMSAFMELMRILTGTRRRSTTDASK